MVNLLKKLLLLVCCSITFIPVSAYSATILVESENFTAYQDIAIDIIHSEADLACTSGYFLDGFDYENDEIYFYHRRHLRRTG
jgi:hypothetical protein